MINLFTAEELIKNELKQLIIKKITSSKFIPSKGKLRKWYLGEIICLTRSYGQFATVISLVYRSLPASIPYPGKFPGWGSEEVKS